MKRFTIFLLCVVSLASCATLRSGSEIQAGRYALRRGEPKEALVHFRRVAEVDPDYVTDFTPLKQGVWTYLGRAYYETGNLAEAQRALERADSLHKDDYMADLYLGLVLARQGQRESAYQKLEDGLRGLGNWLEYMDAYHPDGPYWDPGRNLRNEIEKTLALLKEREFDWSKIIARAEYIGGQMEDEVEQAPRRERRDRRDDGRERDRHRFM
jgi:tetratricopeptide (TPR) repeat protein